MRPVRFTASINALCLSIGADWSEPCLLDLKLMSIGIDLLAIFAIAVGPFYLALYVSKA